MTTNDARRTREIKSSFITEKAAFYKKKTFYQQTGLKFKEETSEVLRLEHNIVVCWNLDTSESRPEILGKFWNMLLEKDGDQLDRSCEKWSTAELSYNNFGLCDISAIALYSLWYQLIPHKARVFLPRLVRHT